MWEQMRAAVWDSVCGYNEGKFLLLRSSNIAPVFQKHTLMSRKDLKITNQICISDWVSSNITIKDKQGFQEFRRTCSRCCLMCSKLPSEGKAVGKSPWKLWPFWNVSLGWWTCCMFLDRSWNTRDQYLRDGLTQEKQPPKIQIPSVYLGSTVHLDVHQLWFKRLTDVSIATKIQFVPILCHYSSPRQLIVPYKSGISASLQLGLRSGKKTLLRGLFGLQLWHKLSRDLHKKCPELIWASAVNAHQLMLGMRSSPKSTLACQARNSSPAGEVVLWKALLKQ